MISKASGMQKKAEKASSFTGNVSKTQTTLLR